jgi:4-diphosphocytidyl-2-C-methyl-D-erythritol kinase
MKEILIQANAKINLDFEILGKREDGYHLIRSTFQSINLSDFLHFKKSKKTILTGAFVCKKTEQLIFKAKNILEKKFKKKFPCSIHLQKTIPIASGLGGGSADGAATLFAINYLYDLNLSKKDLAKIGIEVGADVPFFFFGGTCKVEGIGEKITPLRKKLPKFFVVFRPHKRIETKKMYELYDKTGKSFFELSKEICPEVKKVEKYLLSFNLKPKLTGSGPTVFCQINNLKLAQKIVEKFEDFNGDIFICQPEKQGLKIWKTS